MEKNIVKNILKPFSKMFATNYFACSENAGRWLFGNKTFNQNKVKIIHNAIETERFKYNENIRNSIRKELHIEDKFVLGHVGRFVKQKNHDFLIDIFYEVYKKNKDSILLLIGDGPLEEKIKNKVKKLKLEEVVYFLGVKNNVNEFMQAMDVLVFPSLYEGLGMVTVEAQCAALKVICSSEVPKEIKICENVKFLDFNDLAKWINNILDKNNERIDCIESARKNGYEIAYEVNKLEKLYVELERNV